MESVLIGRVLDRLGVARNDATADRNGLETVYGAWCRNVPFDNVVKRIHLASGDTAAVPNIEPTYFFESWLAHGTGGTCWPSTLALHALLIDLGFEVRLGSGAMRDDIAPDIHSHGTLLVTTRDAEGDHLWWVDTSMLTAEPVPLRRGEHTTLDHPRRPVRVEPVGDLWRVHWQSVGNPNMRCLLLDDDVTEQHCRKRYEWSREFSPFNLSMYATRTAMHRDDEFVTGEHVVRDAEGVHRRAVGSDERDVLLHSVFGYSHTIIGQLPPDVLPVA